MSVTEVYEYDFDEIIASVKAMKYRMHSESHLNGLYGYMGVICAISNAFGGKQNYIDKPIITYEEDIKKQKANKMDDLSKDEYMRKQLLQWK